MDTRPPPPPHGANTSSNGARSSHLPPGNYDIFVIPPHSAGSGFLYLPSMQPHRNSFLAGVASTLVVVGIWVTVIPAIKSWASSVAASGGMAVVMLVIAVGVMGWAFGKTQVENTTPAAGAAGGGSTGTGGRQPNMGVPPFTNANTNAGPKPSWQRPNPGGPATGWEKAREETRKKEEEKRKQEAAEREKTRVREREAREKAAREKVAQDRLRRENEAKANKEADEPAKSAAKAAGAAAGHKTYQKPTAQSMGDDDEYSYRPYDSPKQPKQHNSQSSFASESSWAPSQSTARTTPPPSKRGPYSNKDPDKISIKAVYAFNDLMTKPVAQLVAGVGSVTDGLILKMTTEGLFVDDDVRGVGQREWDIKAWTLKLVETGELKGKHVLKASVRDAENKKYYFVIDAAESWKVAVGLQRLRRGSQVRSLGVSGLPTSETRGILVSLGWLRE